MINEMISQMKKLYTINYDRDYVFKKEENAIYAISGLKQRFPDETFDIDIIDEKDPEFTEYEQYAD